MPVPTPPISRPTLRRALVPTIALTGVIASGIALAVTSADASGGRTPAAHRQPIDVSQHVVPSGAAFRVSGTGCVAHPGQPASVVATLTSDAGDLDSASKRPNHKGMWTLTLHVPKKAAGGEYSVEVTCDNYSDDVNYGEVEVEVKETGHVAIGEDDDSVEYGQATVITGKVVNTATGRPIAHVKTRLESRPAGASSFHLVTTVMSSATGAVHARITPTANSTYRWVYPTGANSADVSQKATVSVQRKVTLSTATVGSGKNRVLEVFGTVTPAAAGQDVALQRRVHGQWTTFRTTSVKRQSLPGKGQALGWAVALATAPHGSYQVRAVAQGNRSFGTGVSAAKGVTVR